MLSCICDVVSSESVSLRFIRKLCKISIIKLVDVCSVAGSHHAFKL